MYHLISELAEAYSLDRAELQEFASKGQTPYEIGTSDGQLTVPTWRVDALLDAFHAFKNQGRVPQNTKDWETYRTSFLGYEIIDLLPKDKDGEALANAIRNRLQCVVLAERKVNALVADSIANANGSAADVASEIRKRTDVGN